MNEMADMKLPKEKKSGMRGMPVANMREDYPYGLRIDLNNEQIEKIKGASDLSAGDTVHIVCQGTVKSKSTDEREKGKKEERMCIQLEKISLDKGESPKMVNAILYGGKRNLGGKK